MGAAKTQKTPTPQATADQSRPPPPWRRKNEAGNGEDDYQGGGELGRCIAHDRKQPDGRHHREAGGKHQGAWKPSPRSPLEQKPAAKREHGHEQGEDEPGDQQRGRIISGPARRRGRAPGHCNIRPGEVIPEGLFRFCGVRAIGRFPQTYTARLTNQAGFALAEILVSMLILMIGTLATLSLVGSSNSVLSKTRAREAAVNLSREILERAHNTAYSQVGEPNWSRDNLDDTSGQSGHQLHQRERQPDKHHAPRHDLHRRR